MDMNAKAAKAKAALQQLRRELRGMADQGSAGQADAISAYLYDAQAPSLARLYDLVKGSE